MPSETLPSVCPLTCEKCLTLLDPTRLDTAEGEFDVWLQEFVALGKNLKAFPTGIVAKAAREKFFPAALSIPLTAPPGEAS
jgi:hypothetical protein